MTAQRIIMWGNSGSGKSTLAATLSAELGLPVHHIDKIMWRTGWQCADPATFEAMHQTWIDQPSWIIEGVGPLPALKRRFARAQLLVFLDTPVDVCRARAKQRIDEDRRAKNRFMADGCRYFNVIERQWTVIDDFARCIGPEIAGIVERDFASIRQLHLDGRKPTAELCAELRQACYA